MICKVWLTARISRFDYDFNYDCLNMYFLRKASSPSVITLGPKHPKKKEVFIEYILSGILTIIILVSSLSYESNFNVKIIKYDAFYQNEKIADNKIVYIKNIELSDKNYVCNDFELYSSND